MQGSRQTLLNIQHHHYYAACDGRASQTLRVHSRDGSTFLRDVREMTTVLKV